MLKKIFGGVYVANEKMTKGTAQNLLNAGKAFSFLRAPGLDTLPEGSVPIMVDGHCIGEVGVSGVESPQDAQIAKAGIAAL